MHGGLLIGTILQESLPRASRTGREHGSNGWVHSFSRFATAVFDGRGPTFLILLLNKDTISFHLLQLTSAYLLWVNDCQVVIIETELAGPTQRPHLKLLRLSRFVPSLHESGVIDIHLIRTAPQRHTAT